ncbi:MAG: CoA-binding protein [Bacteroidota bacterium]|nr:CoA-binding protein [Bacteroidota bacterium]
MTPSDNLQTRTNDFLSKHSLAFVGLSRDEKHMSRTLFEEFRKRGYAVYPVNPHADEIGGVVCYPSISALPEDVEAAFIIRRKKDVTASVRECAQKGIRHVWVFGTAGRQSIDPNIPSLAQELGLYLVGGYCPFMFFHDTMFIHRLHAWILRLMGRMS